MNINIGTGFSMEISGEILENWMMDSAWIFLVKYVKLGNELHCPTKNACQILGNGFSMEISGEIVEIG